jgi:hypothetical protein
MATCYAMKHSSKDVNGFTGCTYFTNFQNDKKEKAVFLQVSSSLALDSILFDYALWLILYYSGRTTSVGACMCQYETQERERVLCSILFPKQVTSRTDKRHILIVCK